MIFGINFSIETNTFLGVMYFLNQHKNIFLVFYVNSVDSQFHQ